MTQPTFQTGDLFAGKYRIERILAQGGMGFVVSAIHVALDQRVALKFMLPETMGSQVAVTRFVREARASVKLKSEHVAKVLDVGTTEEGAPYIVMEFLVGEELASVIKHEGKLKIRNAVNMILQAAEGIAEAHSLGIIHRDLKPANMFVTRRPDGTTSIKVLDFGIAKMAGGPGEDVTKTSAIMGTPLYMSPEQMRSTKDTDPRSDIWSIGMILYEMLGGQVAFNEETFANLCTAILFKPLPPLSALRPDIPPALEAVVAKAMEKDPAQRYPTLAEFAQALTPWADSDAAAVRIWRTLLGGVGTVGLTGSHRPPALAVQLGSGASASAVPVQSAPNVAAAAQARAEALANTGQAIAVSVTVAPEHEPRRQSGQTLGLAAQAAANTNTSQAPANPRAARAPLWIALSGAALALLGGGGVLVGRALSAGSVPTSALSAPFAASASASVLLAAPLPNSTATAELALPAIAQTASATSSARQAPTASALAATLPPQRATARVLGAGQLAVAPVIVLSAAPTATKPKPSASVDVLTGMSRK